MKIWGQTCRNVALPLLRQDLRARRYCRLMRNWAQTPVASSLTRMLLSVQLRLRPLPLVLLRERPDATLVHLLVRRRGRVRLRIRPATAQAAMSRFSPTSLRVAVLSSRTKIRPIVRRHRHHHRAIRAAQQTPRTVQAMMIGACMKTRRAPIRGWILACAIRSRLER